MGIVSMSAATTPRSTAWSSSSQLEQKGSNGIKINSEAKVEVSSGVALSINNGSVKFWSSGAVELGSYTAFKDKELVTKAYVDGAIGDIDIPDVDLSDYLPLTGGQMTGPITSNRGNGDYALRIEQRTAHTSSPSGTTVSSSPPAPVSATTTWSPRNTLMTTRVALPLASKSPS